MSGFIHDAENFVDQHPGGAKIIQAYVGQDATPAFFGGVYDHSNAAHNVSASFNAIQRWTHVDAVQLLASMRVGALHGGLEQVNEDAIPPCQKLQIVAWKVGLADARGDSVQD